MPKQIPCVHSSLCPGADVFSFSPLILHVPHADNRVRDDCSFSPLTLCAYIKVELLCGQLSFPGYLHCYEIYAYFSSGFRNASLYMSASPKTCFSLLSMHYPSAALVQKVLLKSQQMSPKYFKSTFKVAQFIFISHFCGHVACVYCTHKQWKK